MRYTTDDPIPAEAPFTFDDFLEMDIYTQQHTLASLEGTDLRGMIPVLEDIVESVHLSPLIVTFAVTLLHQASYSKEDNHSEVWRRASHRSRRDDTCQDKTL